MYNALEELSELSLLLQDRNTTLPRADYMSLSKGPCVKVYGLRIQEAQRAVELKLCNPHALFKKDYFLYSPPKELKPLLADDKHTSCFHSRVWTWL